MFFLFLQLPLQVRQLAVFELRGLVEIIGLLCPLNIGVELFEGTKNYVFITGFDRNSSNLSVKTATAGAIFLDGTMDEIEVNVTDTN